MLLVTLSATLLPLCRSAKNTSLALQAALTYLAVQRYRAGVTEPFAATTGYEPDMTAGGGIPGAGVPGQPGAPSPYSTYAGGETGDPYQQPPFSGGTAGMGGAGMQGGGGMGGMGAGTNALLLH